MDQHVLKLSKSYDNFTPHYYFRVFNKYAFAKFDFSTYKKIPGPPLEPFLGNIRLFNVPTRERLPIFRSKWYSSLVGEFISNHNITTSLIELGEEYGPVYRVLFFSNPKVVLNSPAAYETVMGNTKYINKGTDYE